jgi:hypothetical protein
VEEAVRQDKAEAESRHTEGYQHKHKERPADLGHNPQTLPSPRNFNQASGRRQRSRWGSGPVCWEIQNCHS